MLESLAPQGTSPSAFPVQEQAFMSDSLEAVLDAPRTIPGDDIYDISIIGAGPTGQFAAFYAGLRGARTQMIDALEEPGGALTAIYPEKYI
jgi:alkyl hydroperoxide reductase subunit AhpF